MFGSQPDFINPDSSTNSISIANYQNKGSSLRGVDIPERPSYRYTIQVILLQITKHTTINKTHANKGAANLAQ